VFFYQEKLLSKSELKIERTVHGRQVEWKCIDRLSHDVEKFSGSKSPLKALLFWDVTQHLWVSFFRILGQPKRR
jgi:hypothetical protein